MATRADSKNFRRRRSSNLTSTIFVCVAILASSFILTRRSSEPVATQTGPSVVAEFDTINLPVPVGYVPAGTRVQDITFKHVAFPRHQIPDGALQSITSVADAVTIAPLPANLPLFRENFNISGSNTNSVLDRIPSGMRAMTIKVDAIAAVEGWAGSGSLVDVVLNQRNKTTVIAESVKILSAERSVSPVEGNAAPNVPSTATILVTQEQCLAINTAVPLGRLSFALRNSKDLEKAQVTSFVPERLENGDHRELSRSTVNGYISVQGKESAESFALTDGVWIKTEVVPEGFLPSRER